MPRYDTAAAISMAIAKTNTGPCGWAGSSAKVNGHAISLGSDGGCCFDAGVEGEEGHCRTPRVEREFLIEVHMMTCLQPHILSDEISSKVYRPVPQMTLVKRLVEWKCQ